MSWTAIVPIKPPAMRKTRLAGFDADARLRLTERMLAHVIATLDAVPQVGRTLVLSTDRGSDADRIADEGRGLNAELAAARAGLQPADIVVLHADLPLLTADDVVALLVVADRHGAALAPDRHGTGTNALALRAGLPFAFRFGPGSRDLHEAQLPDPGAVVARPGLAHDIDTPDDIAIAGLARD